MEAKNSLPENSLSIRAYDDAERALSYNRTQGFDPPRKERMFQTVLSLLTVLVPQGKTFLELGAGTGLLTGRIAETKHLERILCTDGAPAMLEVAQGALAVAATPIKFSLLDFSSDCWAEKYRGQSISAVASAMAIHHVQDKRMCFSQVYAALAPGSIFVFADHMAGSSAQVDRLIGEERGRTKLSKQGEDADDPVALALFLEKDAAKQAREGNQCESLAVYLEALQDSGFADVDCLWRDYWLAIF